MTVKSWEELKAEGNAFYTSEQLLKAAVAYTGAIKCFQGSDSDLAVLHSNRCAAFLKLNKMTKALDDAEKCIQLRPDWEKGYFRKGSVHEATSDFDKALQAYKDGAQRAPASKEMLAKAERLEKFIRRQEKMAATSRPAATRDVK